MSAADGFGLRLSLAMQMRGVSANALAQFLSSRPPREVVGRQAIADYLQGKTTPTLWIGCALADQLEVSSAWLLVGKGMAILPKKR